MSTFYVLSCSIQTITKKPAPMAYFIAIAESKNMHSPHQHNFLYVNRLENHLLGKKLKLTVRKSYNNFIALHRTLDIIYCAKEFESKCSYKYITSTMNIKRTKNKWNKKFECINQEYTLQATCRI